MQADGIRYFCLGRFLAEEPERQVMLLMMMALMIHCYSYCHQNADGHGDMDFRLVSINGWGCSELEVDGRFRISAEGVEPPFQVC